MAKIHVQQHVFVEYLKKCFVKGHIEDCVILIDDKQMYTKSGQPEAQASLFLEVVEEKEFKCHEKGSINIRNVGNVISMIKELEGLLTVSCDGKKLIIKDETGEKQTFSTDVSGLFQCHTVVADKNILDRKKKKLLNKPLKNGFEVSVAELKRADKRAKLLKYFVYRFVTIKQKKDRVNAIKITNEFSTMSSIIPLTIHDTQGNMEDCNGVIGSALSELIPSIENRSDDQKVWLYFGKIGLVVTDNSTFWYVMVFARES